jgi:hypothetical protein
MKLLKNLFNIFKKKNQLDIGIWYKEEIIYFLNHTKDIKYKRIHSTDDDYDFEDILDRIYYKKYEITFCDNTITICNIKNYKSKEFTNIDDSIKYFKKCYRSEKLKKII